MPSLRNEVKARIVEEQRLRDNEDIQTGVKALGKMTVVVIGLAIAAGRGNCGCGALVPAGTNGYLNSLGF